MTVADIQTRIGKAMKTMPQSDSVRRLSLFGSHLHGSAGHDSDIDLLIEFTAPVGYFALVRLQHYLEKNLQTPVDLVTPDSLSTYIRPQILAEAQTVYEQS